VHDALGIEGRRVRRFRAVVGAPGTPTPLGLAAIYERNRQPNPGGFLGPWAMPLTIMSNVLENYGGSPGRVGIHGRAGASLLDPLAQRPLARLHPHRQPPHLLDGRPRPGWHSGAHPALTEMP
jgi:L,D-transpeptidase-like protein